MIKFSILSVVFLLMAPACKSERSAAEEIRNILELQETAWNKGDLSGYMQGYWQSDSLRFASGGSITYGWRETLARYQSAYAERSKMGLLRFSILEIRVSDKKNALVFGRWSLQRAADQPGGLFTLFLRNINGEWLIVADHTSSDSEN